jgi:hypothetical protein
MHVYSRLICTLTKEEVVIFLCECSVNALKDRNFRYSNGCVFSVKKMIQLKEL